MVNAVDSFLNNAVDLYVKPLTIAEFRQIKPESGDVRQMLSGSGDIMPDSGQTGRNGQISGYLVGILEKYFS
jgi:hypothetical protein